MSAKGHLLVADDEPGLRRAYARFLRDAGYVVEEADDGLAAILTVTSHELDAIVSDIGMPGADGIELLSRVRERDLDVPVILMTGQPRVETAIRAVEFGAMRYLVKPIDAKTLVATVDQAVQLHRLAKLKRQALALQGDAGAQPGDRGGLEASLDRALTSLWMAYQPIVSVTSKAVFAFEALMRTSEPTLPHPGAVLEAAERLGRLNDLGRAIRALVGAVVPDAPVQCLFVNLHSQDLLDPSLYEPASPLSAVAKHVVLEITERATLDDVNDLAHRVAMLRDLGFRIAVDDLGAGYAGLTSFAQLEPDVVKLDMALVRGVHENPTKRKLIRSMATLCRDMGMMVVAEGVETVDERDAVVECGCDLIQGFLFARPARTFPDVSW